MYFQRHASLEIRLVHHVVASGTVSMAYTDVMKRGLTYSVVASIQQAVELLRHGQWQEPEALLMPVLAAQPSEPDGLQLLGLVRENQGKLAEAEQLLRQSLAARPRQTHLTATL